jgi:hypothetical protein
MKSVLRPGSLLPVNRSLDLEYYGRASNRLESAAELHQAVAADGVEAELESGAGLEVGAGLEAEARAETWV